MRNSFPPSFAWFVVALLVPVALLNCLDRQMLAARKFSIMQDIPDIGREADWGFGIRHDHHAPLFLIFGSFAGVVLLSILLILLIWPLPEGPRLLFSP